MQKKYMGNFGGTSIIKDQSLLNHEAIKQQIIILDELRDLIPPLQQEESNQLERNILAEGCREALLIWQTTANILDTNSTETSAVYILVDGHNRYGICLKHKLNFKIHLISFDSLKEVRDYMIDNQLGRRNLIPEQASYLRGLRYNTEKLEKGKYTREDHKGQNVPYDLKGNESTEKVKEIHKGQNVPYGSMAKKESIKSSKWSIQFSLFFFLNVIVSFFITSLKSIFLELDMNDSIILLLFIPFLEQPAVDLMVNGEYVYILSNETYLDNRSIKMYLYELNCNAMLPGEPNDKPSNTINVSSLR